MITTTMVPMPMPAPRRPTPEPRSSSTLSLRRLSSSFMGHSLACVSKYLRGLQHILTGNPGRGMPSIGAVQRPFQPPAPVRPQPIGRTLEHVDLRGTGIALGHGIRFNRLSSIPQGFKLDRVVAAPDSPHARIQNGKARRAGDL